VEECEEWTKEHPRFVFEPVLRDPPHDWPGLRGILVEHVDRLYLNRDSDRSRHFSLCRVGEQVLQLRNLLVALVTGVELYSKKSDDRITLYRRRPEAQVSRFLIWPL
jgi:hypothetical protein